MKRIIAAASMALFVLQVSQGCTAFCFSKENHAILAKNLDWPVDAGMILVNRSGVQKSSFSMTERAVTWTSLYSSISFNQFGIESPLGGMNEMGLVVEELNMPAIETSFDTSRLSLNEFQVVQYMLDNFKSVEEVEVAMDHFQTAPVLLSLHYLVMDREGRSLIMEFDGSQFNFYYSSETGFPILSNNLYLESIRYLKNFQGFGGDLEVHHRPGSNERFVSVANMLSECDKAAPVKSSFAILDTVSQMDTRWSIVYDASKLTIHLRFHNCAGIKEISLKQLLAMEGHSILGADVADCKLQVPHSFSSITSEENRDMINSVVTQLSQEMDLNSRKELFDNLICYSKQFIIEKNVRK